MNKKVVRIFLAAGLVSLLGLINACTGNVGEGDNGVQEENIIQPDEEGDSGVQEENTIQPDEEGEDSEN